MSDSNSFILVVKTAFKNSSGNVSAIYI